MSSRDTVLVSRTLYQIGVVTLIAAIMWVIVGVYSVSKKDINLEVDKQILTPLSTEIDQEVVDALTNRLKIQGFTPLATPSPIGIEETVLLEPDLEETIIP